MTRAATTKAATIATPPDFGTGRVCDERSPGISSIRTLRIMNQVSAADSTKIAAANARCVRNAETEMIMAPWALIQDAPAGRVPLWIQSEHTSREGCQERGPPVP